MKMRLQRIWIMFRARNKEYIRDRAAYGLKFAIPIQKIIGFGVNISGENISPSPGQR
ncbi:MAG: hypothetical protein P8X39_13380 [Desulfofustis sp.]